MLERGRGWCTCVCVCACCLHAKNSLASVFGLALVCLPCRRHYCNQPGLAIPCTCCCSCCCFTDCCCCCCCCLWRHHMAIWQRDQHEYREPRPAPICSCSSQCCRVAGGGIFNIVAARATPAASSNTKANTHTHEYWGVCVCVCIFCIDEPDTHCRSGCDSQLVYRAKLIKAGCSHTKKVCRSANIYHTYIHICNWIFIRADSFNM